MGDGLVGGAVAAAAAASFAALRAASRGSDADARAMTPDMLVGNGAVTLEQIVREELRPLLKAWLDANLPPLVERLVKAELERVARG
jgi:cell pole-organizing protein PopZ